MIEKNSNDDDDNNNIKRYKEDLRKHVWDGRVKSGTLPLVACQSQKLHFYLMNLCANILAVFIQNKILISI